MSLYIGIINNVINYIEENITERLTVQSISERFYLSESHFSRLFTMAAGISVKRYILGRKLAAAAEKLQDPKNKITDIACALGFEYPEVFSRDFKKWFGTAPSGYRKARGKIAPMPKALVIERDIINLNGSLSLKETYKYIDSQNLYGVFIEADENAVDFYHKLQSAGETFLTDKKYYGRIKDSVFYTAVNCLGDDSGRYSVFYGGEPADGDAANGLSVKNIPAGWYACLAYYGEMPDMLKIFKGDFYKWIIAKEIEINPNGIGILTVYDRRDMKNLQMLIPVKQPK